MKRSRARCRAQSQSGRRRAIERGRARLQAAGQDRRRDQGLEKMVKEVPGVHAGTYGLAGAYMEKKEFAKRSRFTSRLSKLSTDEQAAAARSGEGWRQGWLRGFFRTLSGSFAQQKWRFLG